MKAFVERLCEHAGLVRCGENAEKYGDPFTHAIAYVSDDHDNAIIKALTSPGDFTIAHARAIISALKDIGLRVTWERIR